MCGIYLTKAEEYLASAERNLGAERLTTAADSAIHAGVLAKNAIVSISARGVVVEQDDAVAVAELRLVLADDAGAAEAECTLRELLASKERVGSSPAPTEVAEAARLVQHARILVQVAAVSADREP